MISPGLANALIIALAIEALLGLLALSLLIQKRIFINDKAELGSFLKHCKDKLFTSPPLFYYFDIDKQKDFFSNNLRKTLNLKEGAKFHELLNIFDEEDFSRLEQNITGLKETRFFFQELKVRGHKQIYEIVGEALFNGGKLKALIVIFADATAKNQFSSNLKCENQAFKNENQNLLAMINNSPFPVWQRNKDLDIIFFNDTYRQIIKPEEGGAAENLELYNPAHSLAEKTQYERTRQTKNYHIVVNAERRLYEITEVPYLSGTLGYAIDITEQEKIQENLNQQLITQSDILENSTSAIAIFGSDTRIKFYNNAFINLWHLEERWLGGEPGFSEILDAMRTKRQLPEQANFRAFKDKYIKFFTDLIEPYEEFFYLPDDRTIRALFIPHAVGGLILSCEDITDRLALERSFNNLVVVKKTTLDNLYEGIAVFGEDGRIKLSNPMYAHFWQLQTEWLETGPHISEILEKTKNFYMYGNDWEKFKNQVISLTVTRKPSIQKLERADGIVLNWSCVPLPDGAILMTYDDITDSSLVEKSLRERNDALEQGDRLKNRFLANVSYELRSPLTTIKGFTEMLLSKQYFPETSIKQKEYLNAINSASNDLMLLINNVLDISSIESGHTKMKEEKFNFHTMLKTIIKSIESKAAENGIEIILSSSDVGYMIGDKNLMKQAVLNIVLNSIKYIKKGGKINIVTEKNDKKNIVLTILDTSTGFDRNSLKNIKNISGETSMNYIGSSSTLSLSIARSLIELHGGEFSLISEPDLGTKVICTLQTNL